MRTIATLLVLVTTAAKLAAQGGAAAAQTPPRLLNKAEISAHAFASGTRRNRYQLEGIRIGADVGLALDISR
jgi:hypothetical protein